MDGFLQGCLPYWKTGCIHNETVLCVQDGNGICGELQYVPQRILSVTDYALQTPFCEGSDYFVSDRTLYLPQGSRIPWVKADVFEGNIPPPYRKRDTIEDEKSDVVQFAPGVLWTESALLHGNQICVTYLVKPEDTDSVPFGAYGAVAPRFTQKVKRGEAVKISVLGDSVAEGCSASGHFAYAPFQPDWTEMFARSLRAFAGCAVHTENFAVGGKDAQWGAEQKQIEDCARQKPDVLFLHFGINDSGRFDTDTFQKNIAKIYIGVKDVSPDTETVFIKAAMANPLCYSEQRFAEYWRTMDALAAAEPDFYTVDMFGWSVALIRRKKYTDISGNGVNHPNDFASRLYTGTLIHTFIPPEKYTENR